VATTNANDSRPRENRGNTRYNENYRPGTSRENGSNNVTNGYGNKDNKPYNRENKPYQGGKPISKDGKQFSGGNKPNYKDAKPSGKLTERSSKPSNSNFGKSRDQKGIGFNKDKDFDNDIGYGKGYSSGKDQRMGDSRTKSGKEKEQQPDKLETIKRLEKEKKVMQKKSQELSRKSEKPSKPIIKQRRTTNIDWTKGYAKGLFDDDDEDYTEYL
jgi:hypothetical protein